MTSGVTQNLIGRRFGKLLVKQLKYRERIRGYLCQCDCGSSPLKWFRSSTLIAGKATSCYCRMKTTALTHGKSRTPTYRSWKSAKSRCFNPKAHAYDKYGGSGITMCERWRDSFEAFFKDMGERPEGLSLDRWPDPAGNYEPGNCRWATRKEQTDNRRLK